MQAGTFHVCSLTATAQADGQGWCQTTSQPIWVLAVVGGAQAVQELLLAAEERLAEQQTHPQEAKNKSISRAVLYCISTYGSCGLSTYSTPCAGAN